MSYHYGQVFKLKLGANKVVILCSRKAVKDAFVKQAKTFAGRPNLPTFELTRNGQTGLSLCDYSDEYKSNNQIAQAAIHNFVTNENNVNDMLRQEAKKMVRYFDKYSNENQSFHPFDEFRKIVPSLFMALMFRRQYNYDDPLIQKIIDSYKTWFDVAEADNPADFFPFMLYLPNERLNVVKKCAEAFEKFSMSMIDEYDNQCLKGDFDDSKATLFDDLLMQYTNRNDQVLSKAEKLRFAKVLSDMIGGGFDTSSATLSWAMLYLINQPEILKKCRQEINANFAPDEEISICKAKLLPYLSAVMYEIFRLSTVAPLGILHQVNKETTLMGYHVPKDTMVLANFWQVNHDPERWEEPEKIHPEHFLTEDNVIDFVSVRELMTFSCGIRKCPGNQIAFQMNYMLLGNLIRHFDFSIDEKPEDMIPQRGLTLKPKPFTMKLTSISS